MDEFASTDDSGNNRKYIKLRLMRSTDLFGVQMIVSGKRDTLHLKARYDRPDQV